MPLIIFAYVIYQRESKLARKSVLSHIETIVTQNEIMIKRFLSERIHDLNLLVSSTGNISKNVESHLKLMQKERKIYKNIFVADTKGNILYQAGTSQLSDKMSDQNWFKTAKNGIGFVGDINFAGSGNKYDILIALPIISSTGDTSAVLGATISFQGIADIMKDTGIGETGEVYLMNRDGIFLTTTRIGKGQAGESLTVEKFTGYFRAVSPGEYIDYRGKRVVRVYKNLSDLGWFIVGEQDSSEVFGNIGKLRKIFIGFVTLLIALIALVGYVISNRMVHLLKIAYEQNKELELQIIQKDKLASMGLLTAGIAHELNTPLASALLYTQMLKEDVKHSLPSHFNKLSSIEEEIKRGSRIIRNLLDFTRQSQTDSQVTDVNQILNNLLTISATLCSDRGIEIRKSLKANIPLVNGNSAILHQVFMNIFANALEAMEKGGVLNISTRYIGALQEVAVEIQDTGPGIPEEHLDNIFDPFFTTKASTEGTGLGLAISYSMIKKMGGNIRVTSCFYEKTDITRSASGTTFIVELPVKEEIKKTSGG